MPPGGSGRGGQVNVRKLSNRISTFRMLLSGGAEQLSALRRIEVRREGESPPGPTGRAKELRGRIKALRSTWQWLSTERLTRHNGKWVINSLFPPIPGVAHGRMCANLFPKPKVGFHPHSAYLAITDECPADCWHCSLADRRGGPLLTTEQWKQAIRDLAEMQASVIAFTGGEPLLRSDLPELVRTAAQGGCAVQVLTSGVGLNRTLLRELKEVGLWALGVSLDHTDPAVFNQMRNRAEAFSDAAAAVKVGAEMGLYTFINAVPTSAGVAAGEHVRLHHLAGNMGANELRLVEPKPCGKLAAATPDVFLSEEQMDELSAFHCRTNQFSPGPKVCSFSHIEGPELFGCMAGNLHLYIDPSGRVCPCDVTPLSFGNVSEEPLVAIYERMKSSFGVPRRHCFSRCHQELLNRQEPVDGYPLPPEQSAKVVEAAGRDELPDFFKLTTLDRD
jgi:MoaA/NifB/PqqE/SkfB family radical SAM enzyme